jgi:hypothetical protein
MKIEERKTITIFYYFDATLIDPVGFGWCTVRILKLVLDKKIRLNQSKEEVMKGKNVTVIHS